MSEEIMNLSVFDTLCIKKPTKLGNIIDDMPKPPFFIEADDVPPLLKTRRLDEKIPSIPIPLRYKTNYTRGRLGEEAVGQINVGDIVINDPYNYEMERKYEEVHDPSLSAYYNKPANIKRLKDLKIINDEHEILCSLKDYNNFRRYLHRKNIPQIKEIINREVNEKKEKRKFYQFLKNSKVAYQSAKKQDRVNMAKKEAEAKRNKLSAMNPRCKSRLDRIVIANVFHDTVVEKQQEEHRKKGQEYKERMEDYFKEYEQVARRYKIDYYKKSKLLDEHVANRIQEMKERKQAARLRYNDKRWIARRDQQMALIKQNAFHLKQYKRYFETMSLRRKWGFNEAVFEQNELEDLSDEEDLDVTESKEKMHAELKYSDEFKQALNGGKFHIVQLPGSEHKASKALRKYIKQQETPMDRMVKKTVPRAVKEAVALTFRRAVFLYAFKEFYQNMLESVEEAEASALKIRGKPDLRRVLMDEYAKFGPRSNIPMASIERSLCLRFDEEGKPVKYPCVHCCDGGGVCCIPAKRYKPRKKTIGGYYYNCPLCEPELHYKPKKAPSIPKKKSQSFHEKRPASEKPRSSFDSVGTVGTLKFKTGELGDTNASIYSLKSFSRGKSLFETASAIEEEPEEVKTKKEGKKTPQSAIKRKVKSSTKVDSSEKVEKVEISKKTDKSHVKKNLAHKPDESMVRFDVEESETEQTQKTKKVKKKGKTTKKTKTKKRAKSKKSTKSTKSAKSQKGKKKGGKKKKTAKLLKSPDLNNFFHFSSGISISSIDQELSKPQKNEKDSKIKNEKTKDPFYGKRTLYDNNKEPSKIKIMQYGPLLKSPAPKRQKAHETKIANIDLPDVPEITSKSDFNDFFHFGSSISISSIDQELLKRSKNKKTKDPFYGKRTLYDYDKESSKAKIMHYGPLLKSPGPKHQKSHETEILNIDLPDVPEMTSNESNSFFHLNSNISISSIDQQLLKRSKNKKTKDPFYGKRTLYDYDKEPSTKRKVIQYGPLLKSPAPNRQKIHKTKILNINVQEITQKQKIAKRTSEVLFGKSPEYIPEHTKINKPKVKKHEYSLKPNGKLENGVTLDKNRTWYIPTGDSAHYATLKRDEVKFYCIDNDCNKCPAPILKVPKPTKIKSQNKEKIINQLKTSSAEIGTQCSDNLLKKEADLYKKKKPIKFKKYKKTTVKLTRGPKVDKKQVQIPPIAKEPSAKSNEVKSTDTQVKIKPILRKTVGKDLKKRETKKAAFASEETSKQEIVKSTAEKTSTATPQKDSSVPSTSKKSPSVVKAQESKTSDVRGTPSAASVAKKETPVVKEKLEIENVQEGLSQTQINAKKLLRKMNKKKSRSKSKEKKTKKKKIVKVKSATRSITKDNTPVTVVEDKEPSLPRIIKPKLIRKESHNAGDNEEEGIIEDKKIKEIKHYCPACDPEQEKRRKIIPVLDVYKKEESVESELKSGSKTKTCSRPILPTISTDIYKSGKKLIMERDRKPSKKISQPESSSESSSDYDSDDSDGSDETSSSDSDQEIRHTCKCSRELCRNLYKTYGRCMEPEEIEEKEGQRKKKSPEETKVKAKSKKSEEHKDFVTIMEQPFPWKANKESVTNPIIQKEKPTKIKTTDTIKTYEKYKKMRESNLPVYFYDKEGRKYSIDNEGKTYHLTSEGHVLPESVELNLFDVKPSGSKFFVDNEGRLYKKDIKGKEELIGAADKYRVDYKGRKYYLDKDGKKFIVDLEGNVLLFDEDHQRYSLDATGKKLFVLPEVHKGNVRFDSKGNLIKPQIQKEDELSKFVKGAKVYVDPDEHRVIVEKEGILYYISSDGKRHVLKGDSNMYRIGSDGKIYLEDSSGMKYYEKTPINKKSLEPNAAKNIQQPASPRQGSLDKGVNFGRITAINDVDEQELAYKDLKNSLARPPTPGANVYEGKYGIRKVHRLADLTKSAPTHPELERIFVQKRKLFDCAHVVLQRVLAYALWKITKLEENDLLTLPIFLRNMQRPKMKAMEMVEGITKISLYYPVKYLTSKRLAPYVDILTRHILYTKNFDIFARPERMIEPDIFPSADEQHDEDFLDKFFKDLRNQLLSRKYSYVSFNEKDPMEYIVEDGEDGTKKVLPQNVNANIPNLPGYYSGVQLAKTDVAQVTSEMVKFTEDGKETKTPDEVPNEQLLKSQSQLIKPEASLPQLNLIQGQPTFPTSLSPTQTPTEMAQVLYYLRVMATQPRLIKPAKSGHMRKQQSRNMIKKQKMKMRNKNRKGRSRPGSSKTRSKSSKSSKKKRTAKKKQKKKVKKTFMYSYGKLEEVFSEISLCDEDIDECEKTSISKKHSLKETAKKELEELEEGSPEEVDSLPKSRRSTMKSDDPEFLPTIEIVVTKSPSAEKTEPEPKTNLKKPFQPTELPKEEPVIIKPAKIVPKEEPKTEKIERERSLSECPCIRDMPSTSTDSKDYTKKLKDYIYSDSSDETDSSSSSSTSSESSSEDSDDSDDSEDSEEIKVDKKDKRSNKAKASVCKCKNQKLVVSKKKKIKDVPVVEEKKVDIPKNIPPPCVLPIFSRADIQRIQWEQHIPGFDRKNHMALLFKLIHAKLNKYINFTETECTCNVIIPDILSRLDPNYILKIIVESKIFKRDSIHDKYQHRVDYINNFNKPVQLLPQRDARIQKLEEILRQQINTETEDLDDSSSIISQASEKQSTMSVQSQKKKERAPSLGESLPTCPCTGNCIVTQSYSKMHEEMLKNMNKIDKEPEKGLGAKYKKLFMDPSKQGRRGKICFDAREAWEILLAERRAEAARVAEALRLAKEAEALRLAEEAEALRLAQEAEPEKVRFATNIEITYTTKKTTKTKSSETKSTKSKKSKKGKKGKKKRGKSKPGKVKTRTTTRTRIKTVTRTKTRSGTRSTKRSKSAKTDKTDTTLIRKLKKGKVKLDKLNKTIKKRGK